jgi:hypothetical protein
VPSALEGPSRLEDHALAGALRVEHPIGLLGLIKPPAVREQFFDRDAVVGDELGAVGLAVRREGPGADQRDLPAQQG